MLGNFFTKASKEKSRAVRAVAPATQKHSSAATGGSCACVACMPRAVLAKNTQLHALAAHIGQAGQKSRWSLPTWAG